jgi:hypothetical protein
MRRLRDAGIVTMLLLGLTGCAGVQQRLGWTEPPYRGDEDADEHGLSRLAFWRRHRAEETSPADSAADSANPGRSTVIAGKGNAPADDDGDQPGLLRRLPLVGRLWKDGDREDSNPMGIPALRYGQAAAPAASTAFVPTRPAAAAAADPTAVADVAPPPAAAPTPGPAPAESTAAAQFDGPEPEPLRELTVDLSGGKRQLDAAAMPAAHPGAPAEAEASPPVEPAPEVPAPSATMPDPAPQAGSTPPPPAVPSRLPSSSTPTATPGALPDAAPDLAPATTNREPSLPSPTVGTGDQPASGSWTPSVTSVPGPVWPIASETTFAGSDQTWTTTSPQVTYAPGLCEGATGGKCKIHKLCPFKKHKQTVFASSQYAPTPSAQGVSGCESTCNACKVKKPCFLKTWLHHKSGCKLKGCKGCKSCSYCGESPSYVSSQSVVSSQQW